MHSYLSLLFELDATCRIMPLRLPRRYRANKNTEWLKVGLEFWFGIVNGRRRVMHYADNLIWILHFEEVPSHTTAARPGNQFNIACVCCGNITHEGMNAWTQMHWHTETVTHTITMMKMMSAVLLGHWGWTSLLNTVDWLLAKFSFCFFHFSACVKWRRWHQITLFMI